MSATCTSTKIPYAKKRYVVFCFVTILALSLPYITVDGNHIFLLGFDRMQLHLFFRSFDMQEMIVMSFLLMTMFLSIFFMTTLGGRVWCGWTCPQTIFRVIYRDLLQTKILGIRKSIKNKQKEPKGQKFKVFIGVLIWSCLALIAASNFTWYFVPPEDFFLYLQNPTEHLVLFGTVLVITSFLIYDITRLKEDFCIYVCPYARIQSVMYDNDTIQTVYNPTRGGKIYDENGTKLWRKPPGEEDECTGCEACVKVCPTHIDIRKGMQLECINCLECADACTKVMGSLGKSSLITWTSEKEAIRGDKTKYFRFRTLAYMAALCVTISLLIFFGGKKKYVLLNINTTSQLYKIKDEGKQIDNAYTFLVQNRDNKEHTFYFEIDNPKISVSRPKKPFKLKPGKRAKKIVVLSTREKLAENKKADSSVTINATAFAVDDKKKVFITKPAVFIYPKQSIIDKKKNN